MIDLELTKMDIEAVKVICIIVVIISQIPIGFYLYKTYKKLLTVGVLKQEITTLSSKIDEINDENTKYKKDHKELDIKIANLEMFQKLIEKNIKIEMELKEAGIENANNESHKK